IPSPSRERECDGGCAVPRGPFVHVDPALLTSRPSGLSSNLFARVLYALPLVPLGREQRTNLRRHLTDDLLVGALDHHLRRLRREQLDALRRLVLDLVREAERELETVRPHLGLVADARDFQLL